MLDRRGSGPAANDADDIAAIREVCLQYAQLRNKNHCPTGMYVTPSNESLLVWNVLLFVHQGYYADSILNFSILFPLNYPTQPPTVRFTTDVLHPLISPEDGMFSLSQRFRPWRPRENHIFDVLHYIKTAFKKSVLDNLDPDACLNKEALRIYKDSSSSFANLASQSARLSQSPAVLYDAGPSRKGSKPSGFVVLETKPEDLDAMRSLLGLQAWPTEVTLP